MKMLTNILFNGSSSIEEVRNVKYVSTRLKNYMEVIIQPNTGKPHCPVVYYTDRSKVVVTVLVLLFVALWFILRGDLFYVLPCVILF